MNAAFFILWIQDDLNHKTAAQTGEFPQEFIEACEAKARHRHLMDRLATLLKWPARQRALHDPLPA